MSGSVGKSQSEAQNTSAQNVWGEQSPYLQQLYSEAGSMLDRPNVAQTTGSELATGYASSPALQNLIGQSQAGLSTALNPTQNPYLQGAIQSAIRPMRQEFQENILSGIGDEALGAGQYGGSRQGIAEGIATRGYLDKVGDVATEMAYGDYAGGQERMLNALSQAPTVANLGMMPSQIYQQEGQTPWQNLANYQQLIGAPTTLASSQGTSDAWSFDLGGGIK